VAAGGVISCPGELDPSASPQAVANSRIATSAPKTSTPPTWCTRLCHNLAHCVTRNKVRSLSTPQTVRPCYVQPAPFYVPRCPPRCRVLVQSWTYVQSQYTTQTPAWQCSVCGTARLGVPLTGSSQRGILAAGTGREWHLRPAGIERAHHPRLKAMYLCHKKRSHVKRCRTEDLP
jgi:hypothetical protein